MGKGRQYWHCANTLIIQWAEHTDHHHNLQRNYKEKQTYKTLKLPPSGLTDSKGQLHSLQPTTLKEIKQKHEFYKV